MRIAICTSLFDGMDASLLADYERLGIGLGHRQDWKFLAYQIPRLRSASGLNAAIHMTRTDQTLNDAGEKFDRILWLDHRTMLTPADAVRLLESVDEWHPAVFAFNRDPDTRNVGVWEWTGDKPFGRLKEWELNALVRVSSAGLYAAAFDASVFDALRTPWFLWVDRDSVWPDTGKEAFVCTHFHRQGIPVYAHSGVWATRLGRRVAA
ncbi:MAG TPA: hypothetical protein VM243_02210 [Phycisphaerae bacterium]|nr:hypothetical protein [Phycisphaerae bacterium]